VDFRVLAVCINILFLRAVVPFLAVNLSEIVRRAVYVFSWSPRGPVQCVVEDAASSEHLFLPSWFTGDSAVRRTDEMTTDSG